MMFQNKLSFTLIIGLLLLQGCSSYKYDKVSDIDNIDSNISKKLSISSFNTPLNEDVVIAKYRDLLDDKLNTKNKKQVLRRYGDLLIDKGERLIVSTNRNDYRAGKRMIVDAISTYKIYVSKFPTDADNDYIIYQISRGYELIEKPATAFQYLTYLVTNYTGSSYFQEAQFRRGEYLFTTRKFHDSGVAYKTILSEKYNKTNLFNKTLYKYAWVNFKQERYDESVAIFTKLVDFYYKNNQVTDYKISDSISKGEKDAITDVLRAISLSFSYMGGSQHIHKYTSNRPYTPLLYSSLASLYKNKKRYVDAINTYREFINNHKESRHAYKFHQDIISLYQVAGLSEQIVPEKVRFINNFGPGTQYQQNIDKNEWASLNKSIENNVIDLATYYHAYSKGKQKQVNSRKAEHWYRYYLTHYASQSRAQNLNFKLAELLNDTRQYKKAIGEYEKTAYLYNKKDSKAAYAAISIYEKPKSKDHRWRNRLKNAHLKFYYKFGSHRQADKVLLKASQYQYDDHEYQAAYSSSSILVNKHNKNTKIYASAILIYAHSAFELENYPEAENGYRKAHAISEPKLKNDLWKKAAAAAYLDAKRLFGTNPTLAIQKLTRVGKTYSGTEIAGTASFDAASLLMKKNDNKQAESILISLKNNRSKGFDKKNLHEKLAYIYLNKKQYKKAADEFVYIYNQENDRKTKREILLNIANLYKKGGDRVKAVKIQKEYAKVYKTPLNDYADNVFEIASYYQDTNNQTSEKYWLDKIIDLRKTYKTLPKEVNYTVARANLRYAYFDYQRFKAIKLRKPLKKSLKRKKTLMQKVLKKYEQAIDAGEFKLTTEATYNIANIYYTLSKDILNSERPSGLTDDEYMQYTIILEDQAYPFEEKSINIHEKNIGLAKQGGINKWITRSLDTLSKLQPARYNKHERFVHYVE